MMDIGARRRYKQEMRESFMGSFLILAATLLLMLGVVSVARAGDEILKVSSGCASRLIAAADDNIYVASLRALDLTLEDSGNGIVLTLHTCTGDNAAQCDPYVWDHDGDGVKTQTTLNGVGSTFSRGVSVPNTPVMRLEVTTAPSDGLARITACTTYQ